MLGKLFTFIVFLAFTASEFSAFGDEKKVGDPPVSYEICSPIAISPNSPLATVHSKLLGSLDIELAIFLKGETSFEAIIIWKKGNGYQCDFRVIHYKDVYSDEGLDKDLVSVCKVHIESEPIDQRKVEILKIVIKNQVKAASYKSDPEFKWTNYLDGSIYNVFVKGGKGDVFPMYAATIFNPKRQNSHSCASISLALKIFVVGENRDLRTEPITKLTNYLIEVNEGRTPAVDPFLREAIPDPDFELPK